MNLGPKQRVGLREGAKDRREGKRLRDNPYTDNVYRCWWRQGWLIEGLVTRKEAKLKKEMSSG